MSRRLLVVLAASTAALTIAIASVTAASPRNFVTPLSGAEEFPVRETQARGVAIFQVSGDGSEVKYRLIASNIDNVVQAHIHFPAPEGVNAGIVAWLFPESGPPALTGPTGPQDGVLAVGTLTADDLTGVLAGQPLSALIDALRSGNAYVNVHTNDGADPPNSGPGDFPGGEIRGQID
jgi:hypothetical protein